MTVDYNMESENDLEKISGSKRMRRNTHVFPHKGVNPEHGINIKGQLFG
jgi:hypothetical protein